jgi:hypothetical protein
MARQQVEADWPVAILRASKRNDYAAAEQLRERFPGFEDCAILGGRPGCHIMPSNLPGPPERARFYRSSLRFPPNVRKRFGLLRGIWLLGRIVVQAVRN